MATRSSPAWRAAAAQERGVLDGGGVVDGAGAHDDEQPVVRPDMIDAISRRARRSGRTGVVEGDLPSTTAGAGSGLVARMRRSEVG
jgi:hypothetical protein